MEEVLKQLGLSDSEVKLYQTLLQKGEDTASGLAKKSGVNRRLAYDQVQTLVDKGLVSYTDTEDKRVYRPCDPERLNELVEEKRRDLDELDSKLDNVMPELERKFEQHSKEREVKVFEGKEGIKKLFNDELRAENDTIHLIGSPQESEELLKYFLPTWTEKRVEKNIKIKGVFEDSMRGEVGEHGELEARFLPEDENSNVSIAVYGDKVGITFWINNPLVLMIEDSEAADSFMSYFRMIWESAEN